MCHSPSSIHGKYFKGIASGLEILAIWVEGVKTISKIQTNSHFLFYRTKSFVDGGDLSLIGLNMVSHLKLGIWKTGASKKLIDDILWPVPIQLK